MSSAAASSSAPSSGSARYTAGDRPYSFFEELFQQSRVDDMTKVGEVRGRAVWLGNKK